MWQAQRKEKERGVRRKERKLGVLNLGHTVKNRMTVI